MTLHRSFFITLSWITLALAPTTGLAFTPPADSPLAKKIHPRLFFTVSEIPDIRSRIIKHYKQEFQEFISTMDGLYQERASAKSTYMLYFDTRNYAFLCAVDPDTLDVSHQYTRQQYCDKAVEHVLTIPNSCEDQRHDFATWWREGGCKMSAGLGYDWTYNQANSTQRQQMADKIIALYENQRGTDSFPPYNKDHHNISNQVLPYMHGAIFGPLAIWGDPYVSASKAQEMLDHMAEGFLIRVMEISDVLYGPDADGRYPDLGGSGNPEGPNYGFSIFPAYVYPIAAASSALGNNFFATSPFTKNIPLFYYYKLQPFPVNDEFFYSWHDTGTPSDANFPAKCETKQCHSTLARLLRLWSYHLKKDDPTLAGVVSWMVGDSDFRIPLTSYTYAEGVRQYGLFGMFLGGERDVPPISPAQAKLPLFKRMGDWTIFKSSHDLYNATYLEVDAPIWRYVGGHNKFVPTGLQMSKYGTLLLKTVNTKGGGSCPRSDDSGDPASGSITGPYTDRYLSVSLLSAKTTDQAAPGMIKEGSVSDVGDIRIFDSVSDVYDVFGYDYTKMYKRDFTVDGAVQQVVYLRGAENHEFFVEFNQIVSGFDNRKILHTPADVTAVGGVWSSQGSGQWTSSARTYAVTNNYAGSHGRLFITSVQPQQAEFVKFGGPGYEWVDANGTPIYTGALSDACRNLAGYYTLQIRTREPNLITVYQPGDSQTMTTPAQTMPVNTTNMKGVQIEDKLVLFSLTPKQSLVATGYTVETSQPTRHVLVGFAPLTTYEVSMNGAVQQIRTSKGGVLSFEDDGVGTRRISVGGGVASVPDIPRAPTNLRISENVK